MAARSPVARRELLVLAGLIGAGGLALVASRRLAPVGRDAGDSLIAREALADRLSPAAGNAAGDVTLAVWTDFNCSACRLSHGPMLAAVAADGMTRLSFRDWPIFGADSTGAARIALAAAWQGLYAPLHAALMRGPRADAVRAMAELGRLGGDQDRLSADLRDRGDAIDAMLARHAREAFGLRLAGTPGHLVGPVLLPGAQTERQFRRAISRARTLQAAR